jgi:hypothetical protein
MSSAAVMDGPSGSATLRRLVGGALLFGGALALIAAFLPFMRTEWPAIDGDPAVGVTNYLIQPLLTPAGPFPLRVEIMLRDGALLLGAPIGLVALGAGVLWARRWTPGRRGFVISFSLVALGAFYAFVNAAISLLPVWDSGIGTRRLEYGAFVMFLGYLLALVGTLLLPFVTPLASAEGER